MLDLPDPELATISVSSYLDMLQEEECDLDNKISDADSDIPESSGGKAAQIGTAVHSFFEKNVHDLSGAEPEQFTVPKTIQSQFMTYVKAGLKNSGFQNLIDGADSLVPEKAMIFHTPEGRLLNGVIDLIVRKGNTVTVLDYKTHSGSALDADTLERYKKQVSLYAHGLETLFPGCTFDCRLLVMYSTGTSELVCC